MFKFNCLLKLINCALYQVLASIFFRAKLEEKKKKEEKKEKPDEKVNKYRNNYDQCSKISRTKLLQRYLTFELCVFLGRIFSLSRLLFFF